MRKPPRKAFCQSVRRPGRPMSCGCPTQCKQCGAVREAWLVNYDEHQHVYLAEFGCPQCGMCCEMIAEHPRRAGQIWGATVTRYLRTRR